ncbi:RNA polymerase-binding protein DksA [Curvibacter cyanobacteriorum]|uniref:RNA polymerase-binding protein DksA n=1 Tax=Curvibacter cyanobacteriorum TaxID=3026422 RepID=UPI0039080D8D
MKAPASKSQAAPVAAVKKTAAAQPASATVKPVAAVKAQAKVAAPTPPAAAKSPPSSAASAPSAPPVAVSSGIERSTRPSSRLTQLTVPSMSTAPAVASTAAKASFLHTMPTTMNVSPALSAIKKDPKLANNWKTKTVDQMTDEEVLAMPDSEYMNEKQTAFFRLKLSRLKQDMLNNAGETTEHLREDTVVVPDPADRATIEEEHALELRTRDRERKLLKKIEQSIARIDAGDYGYCDETGEPIGVGRLLARPTATLSLEAQQRRELKQKMFGD